MMVTNTQVKDTLTRFWREEDGNTTIVSIYMSLAILLMTGAAIDVMRYESVRTKMQHTMDRAVLAAADLDQKGDPEDVVRDYVEKAGVSGALTGVTVDEGLNYRTVTATGDTDVDTLFMRMSGIDSLNAPALSTAEEKISKVEISLVLDISGSMGSQDSTGESTKIATLRSAATEFIDTVVVPAANETDQTTVSIVPYNATVNLGSTVAQYFNLENTHSYSNCVIFDDSEFFDVDVTSGETLGRLGHFDRYSTNESSTQITNPWCPDDNYGSILVHSSDAQELKDHVATLGHGGNTAIDLGMKWGSALLSPALDDVVADMIADGHVGSAAVNRPAAFTDTEAMKIVVLMTDGKNTTQYDLKDQFRTGYSNVWIDDRGTSSKSDDRFSVLVKDYSGTSNDVYYWVRYKDWSSSYRYRNTRDGGGNAERMTNAELYNRFGVKAAAKKFWRKPYDDGKVTWSTYSDRYYGTTSIVNGTEADARLEDICEAARDEGIVVFSIAFEAPVEGQAALLDCASSPSHYFAVEGIEITETFHAIARQINNLRLIQ